jgi:hypothetical protein
MPPRRSTAVVFIHGLAKKPSPATLQEIWLQGLAHDNPMPTAFPPPNPGIDLGTRGVPSRFNYYADVFYGTDYETEFESYYESNEADQMDAEGLSRVEPDLQIPQPETPEERAFLRDFESSLASGAVLSPAGSTSASSEPTAGAGQLEIASWLPEVVKEAVIKKAAMEAYYFLFNKEYGRGDDARFKVRDELRSRLLDELTAAQAQANKLVIVSHSMGTMVAYDVLRNCPECPHVDALFTLGSPLGVREVQERLIAAGAADVDFPAASLNRWINVYDPLDPICGADPKLSNDYRAVGGKRVIDVKESNWGRWRHSITHYFAGSQFRARLLDTLGNT